MFKKFIYILSFASSQKSESLAFNSSQDAIQFAEKHQLTDIYIKTIPFLDDENE